ncbi:MAG: hypothetical protein ACKOKC_16980, partial [Chthoniobacterales bacterium]
LGLMISGRIGPSGGYSMPCMKYPGYSGFGEALYNGCSGFAEKWHGHLARDYWTSSAGCRCHAEPPRKDLYRKRSKSAAD